MEKTRMMFVRHGESEGNKVHAFLGHSDAPLSDKGHEQAEKTAKLVGELAKLVSKKRSEYDELRPQYDALASEIDAKIKEIRERYDAVAVQIEKPLMNKYKVSRAKHKKPLVEMSGGACRGCNMSLSSVEQHKVVASIVYACENCGHLLYAKENLPQ